MPDAQHLAMRKMVEPQVPGNLYGEALLEFLVRAANQYADAQQWRVPIIASHFERCSIADADAEVIETAEFLAWRCELANTWIDAQRAQGRPDHELTWLNCINETGVVTARGSYRIELRDWWESPLMPPRH